MHNLQFGCLGANRKALKDDTCWAVARTAGLSQEFLGNADLKVKGQAAKDQFTTKDRAAIGLAQALLAEPGILCVDHLGDSMGAQWTEEILFPVLDKYRKGGLRAVLKDDKCAEHCDPPNFPSTVIWSSFAAFSDKCDQIVFVNNHQISLEQACADGGSLLNHSATSSEIMHRPGLK